VIDEGPCKNNTLLLETGATPGPGVVTGSYTLQVLSNFYTPNDLSTYIQNELRTDNVFGVNTWICTWLEQTNQFVINSGNPAIVFRIRPQNFDTNDDLCNLMGFSYPSTSFAQRVFGSYASMIYTPYFDVVSTNLTKKQNVRDNSTSFITGQNLLCRVYLVSGPGINILRDRTVDTEEADCTIVGCRPFTLYREYNTPKQIYWDTKEFINVIDLTLIDYKGRTLYSQPQAAFQITDNATFSGDAAQFQLTLQVTET
jgi:hypothetical protein